jgi:Amt family ammonium transporter
MAADSVVPTAYNNTGGVAPDWLNKGDNAWQLTAATLVGLQSMPGLVILYGSIVKKKWAVNSAFMALYAFAATLLCWVTWAYKMSFGDKLLPLWGKAGTTLGYTFLLEQAELPSTIHHYANGTVEMHQVTGFYGMADFVLFQFFFAAITVILLAGSLLGRMSFRAWMLFVPLWLAGGYVIHVSSGIGGFVAAYWVRQFTQSLHIGSVM